MNSNQTGLQKGQLPIFSSMDISVEILGELHPILDMPDSYKLICDRKDGWRLVDESAEHGSVLAAEKGLYMDGEKVPFRLWFGDVLVFESAE